ncbi:MAG: hypothetical protein ACXVRH_13155 [Thermoleophilaceae bacterium]
MPDARNSNGSGGGGGKLSPQTLIVASLASLTAAIVVSHFWRGGTPIAAALTPVIVALASEIYRRPAERITRLSSRAASVTTRSRTAGPGAGYQDRPAVETRLLDGDSGPVRVYRHERRGGRLRPVHLKIALATALAAFAIAVAVLTLPELVLGGSLASHGRTTFFGGSHHHKASTKTTTQTTGSNNSSSSAVTKTTTVTTSSTQATTQTTTSTPLQGAPPLPAGATGP